MNFRNFHKIKWLNNNHKKYLPGEMIIENECRLEICWMINWWIKFVLSFDSNLNCYFRFQNCFRLSNFYLISDFQKDWIWMTHIIFGNSTKSNVEIGFEFLRWFSNGHFQISYTFLTLLILSHDQTTANDFNISHVQRLPLTSLIKSCEISLSKILLTCCTAKTWNNSKTNKK